MNFYRWQTTLEEAAKHNPASRKMPLYDRFLAEYRRTWHMQGETSAGREMEKLLHEHYWALNGKPHYNVHPQVVRHLCRTNLDAIPARLLEIPGDFHTVNIRLNGEHPDLTIDPGRLFVRSILFSCGVRELTVDTPLVEILQARDARHIPRDSRLSILIDIGDRGTRGPVQVVRHWALFPARDNDDTLDAEFQKTIQGMDTHDFERACPGTRLHEVMRNCLRMIATIGFMANCPDEKFIEYDVLAKDRAKFRNADEKTKEKLTERARRRRKIGWNVGTNEMFIGNSPANTSPGRKGKYEHRSAHIRSGHFHAVRYGPGKEKVKMKWFRSTIIRPDLGFSEE